eukprot:tig00021217_g19336.t1
MLQPRKHAAAAALLLALLLCAYAPATSAADEVSGEASRKSAGDESELPQRRTVHALGWYLVYGGVSSVMAVLLSVYKVHDYAPHTRAGTIADSLVCVFGVGGLLLIGFGSGMVLMD